MLGRYSPYRTLLSVVFLVCQRIAKGAGGKGPRQKTSKIVKKCQKVFRHFSTTFAQGKKTSKIVKKCQKLVFSTLFDTFRAAPVFRTPFGGALSMGGSLGCGAKDLQGYSQCPLFSGDCAWWHALCRIALARGLRATMAATCCEAAFSPLPAKGWRTQSAELEMRRPKEVCVCVNTRDKDKGKLLICQSVLVRREAC